MRRADELWPYTRRRQDGLARQNAAAHQVLRCFAPVHPAEVAINLPTAQRAARLEEVEQAGFEARFSRFVIRDP
ncbi:MAG: hypothetical protein COW33_05225 [Anaerolineae bacterium CG17_big_fil_post_rev_8_21_14_2_50_57_27]|nr:MAG: hypothetical protein COW33_05225 [Anaerolineae bacterium CG17_big_fil_post_rev_8_21_14_2_50_57_27]